MKHLMAAIGLAAALFGVIAYDAIAAEPAANADKAARSRSARAYGEWRILVRPDKLNEYAKLIETEGLPLFRGAGGRMVGWWNTLVGNLYEQVTIWEYDDMPAFEQAVGKLGKDKRFADFVAKRDPLLAGESNRFLHLAGFGNTPALPQQDKIVIHETHRVPLGRRDAYLKFMQDEGLGLLKRHGFRAVGPWIVSVGNWTEVSYLFCYDSLSERDKLLAAFAGQAEARRFHDKENEFVEEITTRILMPAPFAHGTATSKP